MRILVLTSLVAGTTAQNNRSPPPPSPSPPSPSPPPPNATEFSSGEYSPEDERRLPPSGCPGRPGEGQCCWGQNDRWCSDNYHPGYQCQNNACGSDDCCVRYRIGDYDEDGCPGYIGGKPGGCCLGEADDWCSNNYQSGYQCENNACGDDDCCVSGPGGIIALIIISWILILGTCFSVCACVWCCCNQQQQRHKEQQRLWALQQAATCSGGGVAMPSVVATPMMQPAAVMQPAAMSSMAVTCPMGSYPGDTIQVNAPNGQLLQVAVPPGVAAGSTFMVQLPAAPVAVAQAVPMMTTPTVMATPFIA